MANDLFANNIALQLASGCASTDTSLVLSGDLPTALQTSGGQSRWVISDSYGTEYVIIPGGQTGPTVTGVTRGAEGTTATSHSQGAWVTHLVTAAFLSSATTASSPTTVYSTAIDANFQAFLTRIPSGGKGVVPASAGAITVSGSQNITQSCSLEFEGGASLVKSGGFTDAQLLSVSGSITVEIEAPVGALILDGNNDVGPTAACHGIQCSNGAVVTIRGGQSNYHNGDGVHVSGATTVVRCYDVEASSNITGSNTGNGFYCTQGLLQTFGECKAQLNDRTGFFFDRTSQPGCRLNGYAFQNSIYGADCRSYAGVIGEFVADSNVKGGVAFEFGGDSWTGDTIIALNSGNGTYTSGFGVEMYGGANHDIGTVIARGCSGYGLALAKNTSPLSTTISNGGSGITSGATTIPVAANSTWPLGGTLLIGSELVTYTGISGGAFTGCTRGSWNTTAASHADGVTVAQNAACRNNTVGKVVCDGTNNWDGDPALDFTGGAVHNHVGIAEVLGSTIAVSFGEGVSPATNDYNSIGLLQAENVSVCLVKSNGGSNNRIDRLIATDCWTANSGSYPALLIFDGTSASANNNTIGFFSLRTDTAPAANLTVAQENGAYGNAIIERAGAPARISAERKFWVPANAICETFSRDRAPANVAPSWQSQQLLLAGGVVIPAGQPTAKGTLWAGTTALTMGSSGGDLWFALVRQTDFKVLATTADQGAGASWGAATALTLSWASSYTDSTWGNFTPVVDTPCWLGVMVNLGTGGAPALPSIEGLTYSSVPGGIRGLTPVLAGYYPSSSPTFTTPISVGSAIGITNTNVHAYGYVS